MLFSAVGAVNKSAVFVDLAHTGFTDSAFAHLADNIPCFLVDDCLVSILKSQLFFLWNLDGALVLEC